MKVTQSDAGTYGAAKTQTRFMEYDSLGRMTNSVHPEVTGEADSEQTTARAKGIRYTYWENGLVKTKQDSRVTVSYAYDALGRVTEQSYAGAATPTVKFCYDGQVYLMAASGCGAPAAPVLLGKRKLTGVGSSVGSASYVAFDAKGQVLKSEQDTPGGPGSPWKFEYGYKPSGF